MSISEKVLSVLVNVSEVEEIREDEDLPLYEMQVLDSMKTVELMVALSTEFGVPISPAEFEQAQWATPRKIVEYMERKIGA